MVDTTPGRSNSDQWLTLLTHLADADENGCPEQAALAWQKQLSYWPQASELGNRLLTMEALLDCPVGKPDPALTHLDLDVRNPILAVGSSPAWQLLACMHGLIHGQAVHNWPSDLPAGLGGPVDSLTFIGPPHLFCDMMLRDIMFVVGNSQHPYCRLEIPWGILTARDFSTAMKLVVRSARARLSPAPARRILVTHAEPLPGAPASPPVDLEIINQKETFVDNIVDSISRGADLLSIVAHGRDDVLWVRRGLICGRAKPEPPGQTDRYGGLPSCAYAGECYKPDRTLLDASQLGATVVFVNTCSALKLDTAVYPSQYNVVLRMLDGPACAVIASPFMTDGKLWQNLLFHFLAGAGMPIGEALMIVNNATAASGLDFPGTILVGDPLLSLEPISQPEYKTTRLDDGWMVEAGGAHFVELTLEPGADSDGSSFLAPASGRFSHPQSVYYATGGRRGSSSLFLFSLETLPPTLKVRLGRGDPMSELRTLANETTVSLQGAEWLGIRDQKLERLGAELRNALRSLKNVAQEQRYSLSAAATAQRRTRRFRELRNQADTLLMDWLIHKTDCDSMQFYETYKRGYAASQWQWTTDLCRECNQPLVRFRVSSHMVEGFDRLIGLCSTCGIVTDGDGRLELWFEGDSNIYGTVDQVMTVCVRNNVAQDLNGLLGVVPINGAMYGITVSDGRHHFRLSSQATARFEFRIRASDDTPPHHFWLRCYATSGGLIYAGVRNVWVKP